MAAHVWRNDMAGSAVAVSPFALIRDFLHEVPELEQVFVDTAQDRYIHVLMVMKDKDYPAQERIFEREAKITDNLPGFHVDFKLVIRGTQPLRELLAPSGKLLFARE